MKYTFDVLLFLLIYLHNKIFTKAVLYDCPDFQQHFQKILGYRPPTSIKYQNNLLGQSNDHLTEYADAINIICWNKCNLDRDCSGYVLFLNSSECYGYTKNPNQQIYDYINANIPLIQDNNSVYFEKICLSDVPVICKDKLWIFAKMPGNSLIFQGKKTINHLVGRSKCSELCLMEKDFKCLSASFIASHKNNYIRFIDDDQKRDEQLGTCILSTKDKSNQPDAFRVASTDEEYIENQCYDRGTEQDSCSYEIYSNSRLNYADLAYDNLTQNECKEKCASEKRFFCQGVTYRDPNLGMHNTQCLIHSEDLISLGPRSLHFEPSSIYMKRVKCLNISVTCNDGEMSINYTPYDSFIGRMYVNSHSEECSSQGKGDKVLYINFWTAVFKYSFSERILPAVQKSSVLRLEIGNEIREHRCGIVRAYELNNIANVTRTLVSTLIVIQSNPIVQTQGDRLVKVGCILNSNENGTIDDVAIGSSLIFNQSDLQNEGSLLLNISEAYPKVSMHIIDLTDHSQINDVSLGQNLELQIVLDPTNSIYDIRAIQLIAKSDTGHNSILLLDNNGCPTDLTVFPAFDKIVTKNVHMLSAKFHAFKFAGSSFVNFDVKIQFCLYECPPINCGRNVWSHGRRKRSSSNEPRHPYIYDAITTPNEYLTPPSPSLNENNIYTYTGYQQIPNSTDKKESNSIPDTKFRQIKVNDNNLITQSILSKAVKRLNEGEATVLETSRQNFTNPRRILKQIEDVPLQVHLNVRTPKVTENADSLIYSESSHTLLSGLDVGLPDNAVCINQTLLIFLVVLWIVLQIGLLMCSCILIRKYKRLAEYEDRRILNHINQHLEIDSMNRRVHWADQGRSQVLMYT